MILSTFIILIFGYYQISIWWVKFEIVYNY